MPIYAVVFVVLALVGVIAWSSCTPERTVCENCFHIIERSEIDKTRWFHIDLGTHACNPDDPCSTVASPQPYMEL